MTAALFQLSIRFLLVGTVAVAAGTDREQIEESGYFFRNSGRVEWPLPPPLPSQFKFIAP